MPLGLDAIYQVLAQCKVFISIGTSGTVEPAASLVEEARRAGAHTVELNLEPSPQRQPFYRADLRSGQSDYVARMLTG
jgi:NAD-dependent deacetylase